MIKKGLNKRGNVSYTFTDAYETPCTLEQSGLPDCIWLGRDDADPKILVDKCGWVKYPIHKKVSLKTMMHLSIKEVKELIPILQEFVDNGELKL